MRIVFFFYGTRIFKDTNGLYYATGNFTDKVWNRYLQVCDELTVIMRLSNKIISPEEAKESYHLIDTSVLNLVLLPDRTASIKKYLSLNLRNETNSVVEQEIRQCDCGIVRAPNGLPIYYLRKYNKPYLIECVGCTWDALWNHGLAGKIMAIPAFLKAKKEIKRCNWVVYVTNRFLQNRYPTNGRSVNCSNVVIESQPVSLLEERIESIRKKYASKNPCQQLIVTTCANIAVPYKGQRYVIEALGLLKKKGFNNIQYWMVGGGDSKALKEIAVKLGVENQIRFFGQVEHDKVFEILKNTDLYIQPSLQEGLPRSVIEAMSMAVPVCGTNAGGTPELLSDDMVIKKKSSRSIAELIVKLTSDKLVSEAKRGYEQSLDYTTDIIEKRRNAFFREFVSSVKNEK